MICVLYTAWSYQLCLPKHRLTPPGGVQYTQEWTHLAIAQQWMIWDTTHYTIPPAQTLSTNGEKYRSSSISSSNSYGCSSHSSFCIDSSISSPAMASASAAETAKKATQKILFRAKAHFVQKLNLQFFSIWSSYIFLYLSLSFSLSPPLSLSHSLNGLSLHLCLINVLIEEVRPRPN